MTFSKDKSTEGEGEGGIATGRKKKEATGIPKGRDVRDLITAYAGN